MEVIQKDLTTTTCQDSNLEYPLDVGYASGALVATTMMICGGEGERACYSFDKQNKQWKYLTEISSDRKYAVAIPISNGVWINGGFPPSATTEFIFLNGSKIAGPQLPTEISGQCVVHYKNIAFFLGGRNRDRTAESTVRIINVKDGFRYIGEGPNMNHHRFGHACGIFKSEQHGYRPVIVVAGGFGGDGTQSSEYWDFTMPGSKWELCSKTSLFQQECLSFYMFLRCLIDCLLQTNSVESKCCKQKLSLMLQ